MGYVNYRIYTYCFFESFRSVSPSGDRKVFGESDTRVKGKYFFSKTKIPQVYFQCEGLDSDALRFDNGVNTLTPTLSCERLVSTGFGEPHPLSPVEHTYSTLSYGSRGIKMSLISFP